MERSRRLWMQGAFVVSGVAGLIYETALQRELSRTFGVTAWATATVLAAYMGGLALGAGIFGRIADRVARPLRFYALVEAGVGLCALATPAATRGLTSIFVSLADHQAPESPRVALLRFALAFGFTLIPTVLMGATLPAVARAQARTPDEGAEEVGWLYLANLVGATLGAALTTYLALPKLGLSHTLALGGLLNFAAAMVALAISREVQPATAPAPPATKLSPGAARWFLMAAAWSGFASFAYEVVWTHLLAIVIGCSAYAFGLMLSIFLVGLALGSLWASRQPVEALGWETLGKIQLAASAAVALTLPLWDHMPDLFAAAGPHVTSFAGREVFRAALCLPVLLLPAAALGAFYPVLLRRLAGSGEAVAAAVGRVTATNTAGSVLGSLATGFVLLPHLGSRRLLELLALAGCAVAIPCLKQERRFQWMTLATAALVLILPGWKLGKLAAGSNVYFQLQAWADGTVLSSAESVESGLTTVVANPEDPDVRVLLTNGKFQGDSSNENVAQVRFTQVPLLFSKHRDSALLVGIGTGGSLAVLADAGFKRIDAADLSRDIVTAADRYFPVQNRGVLHSGRVNVRYVDGRNLMLLSDARYDLITMELSSIWIAGEADLYNREFYELVRGHLQPDGVLQQWVQLHHMGPRELGVILNTIRQVFPHVALFHGGGQGEIVASMRPLQIDYPSVVALNQELKGTLVTSELPGGDLLTLTGEQLLDDAGVEGFVADLAKEHGVSPADLVSTDDNLDLEYATPRNNVLPWSSKRDLLARLAPHAPKAPPIAVTADGPAAHVAAAAEVGRGKLSEALIQRLLAAELLGAPCQPLREAAQAQLASAHAP